jgi:hypothetical protein
MRIRSLGLLLAVAAAASGAGSKAPFGNAPYDATGGTPHRLSVSLDFTAGREILAALSLEKLKAGDPAILASLPAVKRQIEDSHKDESEWAADFAAAFSDENRPVTFDLKPVRLERDRWSAVLAGLYQNSTAIAETAARRAAAVLPPDLPVALAVEAQFSFGIPGLADHLVVNELAEGKETVIIDVSRALSGSSVSPGEAREVITRLLAAETFRGAWQIYRASAPGWSAPGQLGPAEPLARAAAAVGPVWLFGYDSNFYPLATWLKQPMVQSIDAFNHEADLLLDPESQLSKRAEVLAGLERKNLQNDLAVAAGTFFADAVYQNLGREELAKALAGGPDALVAAYDRASAKVKALPPLSGRLRELLAANRKKAAH